MRSVAGFNMEVKKGRDEAVKYCKAWEFEIMRISTNLTLEYTSKKITQAVFNLKKEELNRQTEELNKCIKALNANVK
ncbi:MAG: hypothetical protein FWG87_04070 [Defluviitaleaceae bacterium]|nr:hypothetical protein [Defluviitaleaceae bacterium]